MNSNNTVLKMVELLSIIFVVLYCIASFSLAISFRIIEGISGYPVLDTSIPILSGAIIVSLLIIGARKYIKLAGMTNKEYLRNNDSLVI